MEFKFIYEKEIEKINQMFNLMNEISDSSKDTFIEKKMKRYEFIAKTFDYSIETVRKIFYKTRTYRYVRNKNFCLQIFYYDPQIYLERLNNKRRWNEKQKIKKILNKHFEVAKLIKNVAKATRNKTSAKTLSAIILEKLGRYYSPKHLYKLIRDGKMFGVSLNIFPYLKYGKYHKKPPSITKRFITTPISERDEAINKRVRYGDVEIDTVEGTKSDNYYLSTMVDRKSRRLSITLYRSKSSSSFQQAVKSNILKMTDSINSITSDNGIENAKLNELNINWYATNAYSSWQKGTIEQKHKQIRKFIPKGKSFKNLTQEYCDLIALVINAETYLQNSKKYKLGKIVTKEELSKYFELVNSKTIHEIFKLW